LALEQRRKNASRLVTCWWWGGRVNARGREEGRYSNKKGEEKNEGNLVPRVTRVRQPTLGELLSAQKGRKRFQYFQKRGGEKKGEKSPRSWWN